jgi:glucosamine--fructose-6-phosphate aminotransferase (isomerizing)
MSTLLEQEIQQQPDVVRQLLTQQQATAQQIAQAIRAFKPIFVSIVARGTSDNAARYAQYLFGTYARLSVALATPSVHTLYESSPDFSRALVLAISQSGQSEDIRQVLEDARRQGALTVSITNNPASPLAQSADYHLFLEAAPERSIAATKSYTAQLGAIALLLTALVENPSLSASLVHLPQWMSETLALNADLPQWIERYRYMERFAVIGRGYNYCNAYEISLKIKELCYISGEEYSEADFRHGPIALIHSGFPVLLLAPKGKAFGGMFDLLQQLHGRGAECLPISNDEQCAPYAKHLLRLPAEAPEWLTPLLSVLPGQLFAMHLALARGLDVDAPRGLSKVTITR